MAIEKHIAIYLVENRRSEIEMRRERRSLSAPVDGGRLLLAVNQLASLAQRARRGGNVESARLSRPCVKPKLAAIIWRGGSESWYRRGWMAVNNLNQAWYDRSW